MAQNDILAKVSVIINAQTAQLGKDLKGAQSQISSFTNGVTKLAGTLGVAFGIQQVAAFGLEVSKLAGEAQGVRTAFDRLPDSVKVLNELKEATGGTVSELELMKKTVQAANFGISLSALPKLLEFATLRAQQTGQSVDYLVDSIVTGIGRKSPLILDNLGISAVALKKELGGVSIAAADIGTVADAVGRITAKSLEGMAGFSENASTKLQRLNAEWVNFQIELGSAENGIGIMGESIDALTLTIKNLTEFLRGDAGDALSEYIKLVLTVPRYTIKGANAILEFANNYKSLDENVKRFNEEFSNAPFAGITNDTENFNKKLLELGEKAEESGKKIILLRDSFGKVVAVVKPFTNTVTTLNSALASIDDRGIVEKLEEKIKSLGDSIKTATSIESIRRFQDQLELAKSTLDDILKPPPEPVKIPIEFDLKTDDQSLLESLTLSTKLLDPLFVPIDFEIPKENIDAAEVVIDGIKENIVNKFKDITAAANQAINQGLTNVISQFAENLGRVSQGVGSFGDGILEAVAGFAKQFGALLISAGLAKIAFEKLALSGVGAVVAGVALVAAAGAVTSHLNKSKSVLSGSSQSSGFSSSATSSSSNFGTSANQNSSSITFQLKGSDIWGSLNSFNRNSRYTSAVGG